MPKRTTLMDTQKFEFCVYTRDNKRTHPEYVKWIKDKWRVKINESTVTRILQTKDQRLSNEIVNPDANANLSDDLHEAGDSRLENLIRSLNTLCLPNAMETDEFLNFNGEEIVYEVFPEDQIIKELAYMFRNDESIEVMDEGNIEVMDKEEDDSVEPAVVSGSSALNSLKNVRMFLLQQEGLDDQLKSINFLEKFIRKMMSSSAQQTCIDEYFKT
ncbi:17180_t:CDS:2 [Dentiscutata heterogama]|uniref:17180_t:CDS:1 n=1 Tax=Dentiscutata heterogama TaxID=1316150 RepID=A0ACA9KHR3_9GLOM|nr:17180_t:CDS:2 [Dentiscutata heterogama]